jgi:phosphopantothenoylcysteine decarboxylase/phosphopantothenate--cysteine ligase
MLRAVVTLFPGCDALVMTAAVSDYRPWRRIRGKMRRGERDVFLRLAPNPDILKRVRARKGKRVVIGFALETEDARKRALKKLIEKNLDYIVVNSPESMESDRITCEIMGRDGRIRAALANQPKKRLAAAIVKLLEEKAL